MDRHNHSNQSESSPQYDDTEEGTNYLRRLQGKQMEDTTRGATDGAAPANSAPDAPAATKAPGMNGVFIERRATQRYACSGKVEMSAEGTSYCMWGTLTDVSLHGCYVEINNTFPVGTKMKLRLDANGLEVKIGGVVRATYPLLGMGISFEKPEPKQLAQLQQLLKALTGRKSAFGASAV